MEIIKRNPKELIKADYNPRKISDKDFKQLKKSLETFQCVEPIVVNQFEGRENVIVGGHQRLKAMIDLGWSEVPTVEVYLDLDEEKELNVRLNKNTGEFDFELLTDLFDTDKLEEIGFDLDELPDITEDLAEPLTDPDEAPEPPKEPKTKLGDIYELGNHRLMCGDSTSIDAVEKLMDGEKADLLHTDPPYNVDYDNSTRPKAGKDLGKIKNDKMSNEDFYKFLYDFYVSSYSVLKEGSSAYIWHADRE
ncbi:MAG: ParB N-terminal domain-containing protein, partial [Bacteriovoracaceae bacterium]